MTENELNQLYYLKKEINQQEKRLKKLRQSSLVKSSVATGMPRATRVTNGICDYISSIVDTENLIKSNIVKYWQERKQIEIYIDTIEDSEIREIFRLRHIDFLSWEEIGTELNIDRRTASRKYYKNLKNAHNAHCNVL